MTQAYSEKSSFLVYSSTLDRVSSPKNHMEVHWPRFYLCDTMLSVTFHMSVDPMVSFVFKVYKVLHAYS